MNIGYFERLAEHSAWADARTLAALGADGAVSPEALRLVAHVLEAERIYLARMRGEDPWPQDFWPELSLAACAEVAAELPDAYRAFLAGLGDRDLDALVRYRNSRGTEFHTSIADLLTHVFMHGAYHRGQIAAAIRRAGGEPVATDYIAFTRECE
jgi:uncharacterized damage-inducible protein DinB